MVAKRSATADESIEWGREHHPAHFGNARRIGSIDIRWKPALQRGFGDCRYTATLGRDDSLFPLFGAGWGGCAGRIANDRPVDAIGILFGQPERSRAAQRQSTEMRTANFERVHQGDGVG